MIVVRPIPAELTYDIRHIVLCPGLTRQSCAKPEDKDHGTFHLGGWRETRQAGVCTFQALPDPEGRQAFRLRGMAVLPEARRQGVGSLMLLAGEDEIRRLGAECVWGEVPPEAVPFFEKNGWEFYPAAAGSEGLALMFKDLGKPHGCRAHHR